jgi:hypothetical protein
MTENTPPKANPNKSAGELNEARPHPGPETESDRLHAEKDQISKLPIGPYTRDADSGGNPEVDNITQGDEAQKRRDKIQKQRAEGGC